MRMALDQAQAAADAGEVPVGAILVDPATGSVTVRVAIDGPLDPALLGAAGGTPWLAAGYLVLTGLISVVATSLIRRSDQFF